MLYRPDWTRHGIADDFAGSFDTAFKWVLTAPDGGGATIDSDNSTLIMVPSDGTVADNDEIYVASIQELFLFKARKPTYMACRLQFVETVWDKANVIFGVMSGVGQNALIDNGGGPRQSGNLIVWYKLDGGNTWQVQSRDNLEFTNTDTQQPAGIFTTTTTEDTIITATTPAEVLEIWLDDPRPPYTVRDRVMVATFARNGVLLTDTTRAPIRHELNIPDAVPMSLMCGIKNGSANQEALIVDVLYGDQARLF